MADFPSAVNLPQFAPNQNPFGNMKPSTTGTTNWTGAHSWTDILNAIQGATAHQPVPAGIAAPNNPNMVQPSAMPNAQGGTGPTNPLAANAYFQSIAPMLSQIQQREDSRNQSFFGAMNNFLGQVQLPPGIRELLQSGFANSERDIQNVNDTNAAAAISAPGLDALMKQVQAAQTAAKQAYYEELAAKSAGTAGTGTTGGVDTAAILAAINGQQSGQ